MSYQDKILLNLLEMWNDYNPDEKLNSDLISIISEHINHSYVIGGEQMKNKITEKLELLTNNNGLIKAGIALRVINKL